MAEKRYEWLDGATLEEHSRRKHKILREYFYRYLVVRCQVPQQTRFRMAIVDGFAGGGRYKCGTPGSPIIFLEELQNALEAVNLQRISASLGTIEIECLLILNDQSAEALKVLKGHLAPLLAGIREKCPRLHIRPEYLSRGFETAFPAIRDLLAAGRYRNVVFNLDQCGHSHVDRQTLVEIMRTYPSAEIFYTFAIEALLAFLQKSEPIMLANQLRHLGIGPTPLGELSGTMSKGTWLRTAERIVFEAYRACAPYVSPFSINNPEGWRYWLIHFANVYRARQVYNNILHDNSSMQAHFGRSGLNMLSYDPRHDDGALYLFDVSGRQQAIGQLVEDIPRLVSESGDVLEVSEFYENIYNATPAHTDDVHQAIIDNPDLEVLTPGGGERRKANTIAPGDVLRLKKQKSFFPMFLGASKKGDA
jgi:three-Cys-motif partner protein